MASTGEVWKLGHRPALDGLRGIAVLLVVACHTVLGRYTAAGSVGVTMFFTLSGFLITSLLLEESQARGGVSLRHFFLRRALRLLPAAIAVLLVVAVGRAYVLDAPLTWRGFFGALFYVSNWLQVDNPEPFLTHIWSLAVEEQFYLVWPVVLVLTLRFGSRKLLGVLACAGVVGSVVVRLLLWDGGAGASRVYLGSDTRADALLVGCLLALYLHGRQVPVDRGDGSRLLGLLVAALVVAGFATGAGFFLGIPTVVPWAAAVMIWLCVTTTAPRWLVHGSLVWVGQRSYGLYLWHVPIFGAFLEWPHLSGWDRWQMVPVAWACSVVATVLSWRFIESPFLNRSRRTAQRSPMRTADRVHHGDEPSASAVTAAPLS